jgi:16S rRNA (guanine966-N2)-methyltransferase
MRITTGLFKGKILKTPASDAVRPTSDRMRQAIFNILYQYGLPQDAIVMDVFAGTGALGLEALSRGAAFSYFVDIDTALAQDNVKACGMLKSTHIVKSDSIKIPQRAPHHEKAQLIFLDPPYFKNLLAPTIEHLIAMDYCADDCIIVAEVERDFNGALPAFCNVLDTRHYGAATLLLMRYEKN